MYHRVTTLLVPIEKWRIGAGVVEDDDIVNASRRERRYEPLQGCEAVEIVYYHRYLFRVGRRWTYMTRIEPEKSRFHGVFYAFECHHGQAIGGLWSRIMGNQNLRILRFCHA